MIEIQASPDLFSSGIFYFTWHGLFSFIGVATAVYLVGRWGPLRGVLPDTIYSIAIWAIVGGIIGARLFHVVDRWDLYRHTPLDALAFWKPGIAIWGGVIGGLVGGAAYARLRHHPVGLIADLAAPAVLLAQVIGRIGDIVNGEHCAKATDLFFGFIWVAGDTDARFCTAGHLVAVHPAIAYEMAWNLLALAVLWRLRNRLKPPGMLFALYLALYALNRLVTMLFRQEATWGMGLQEAQIVSLVILAVVVPLLALKARPTAWLEEAPAVVDRGTRAQRRRRGRG